jgi:integrase
MAKKSDQHLHLLRRGNQWYLRVAIPRKQRHLFLSSNGRPMVRIVEKLSDSFETARLMAAERVATCMRVFAQVKAGILTTPQQVAAAMRPAEEFDIALQPGFDAAMRRYLASPELRRAEFERRGRAELEKRARWFEQYGASGEQYRGGAFGEQPAAGGERVSQAAEAWFKELARDKSLRGTTLDGHKLRVRTFVSKVGDVPLTDVTRRTAADFLDGLKVSVRTRNIYAHTLKCVFKSAGRRGRFSIAEEANPFHEQRTKAAGSSYQAFTTAELQTLFDKLPREIPKKHTAESALPWVALIALYTGMRLEEIAQLTTADVREVAANGATVWVIDVHNGGENKLKNETSARLIPVHSELDRLGLLDYVKALKAGPLFPGLTRRESKGGKVGARVEELFRKKLVTLKLKRDGLCFHSFRHTVAGRLDAAGVPQSDAARILGHAVAGMSYGTYSQAGPGLKRVAAVVEEIKYDGLRL